MEAYKISKMEEILTQFVPMFGHEKLCVNETHDNFFH
jgi:hypothetical protein